MTVSIHPPAVCDRQMNRMWEAAWLMHKVSELPDVRQDKVDRVKREIEAGSYVTLDEHDAILDGIVDDLALDLELT